MKASRQRESLPRKRQRLIAQAAAERQRAATAVRPWQVPLAIVDVGISLLAFYKQHPVLLAESLLLAFAPRRLMPGRLLQKLWLGWKLVQHFRR